MGVRPGGKADISCVGEAFSSGEKTKFNLFLAESLPLHPDLAPLLFFASQTNLALQKRSVNLWIPLWPDSEDKTIFEMDNDIEEDDFVGNIVIVSCAFLLILVLHVVIVSAIEAYWLQTMKVRSAVN